MNQELRRRAGFRSTKTSDKPAYDKPAKTSPMARSLCTMTRMQAIVAGAQNVTSKRGCVSSKTIPPLMPMMSTCSRSNTRCYHLLKQYTHNTITYSCSLPRFLCSCLDKHRVKTYPNPWDYAWTARAGGPVGTEPLTTLSLFGPSSFFPPCTARIRA